MRAVVLALLVTTACHTTMRSRTTIGGIVEEEGTCESEDVGPHEACREESKFDESKTVLVFATAVAVIVAAVAGASYFGNNDESR
jgi:hypothetical protein